MEKQNLTNSARNGGKTAEMRNNSAKSRMVGMSVYYYVSHIITWSLYGCGDGAVHSSDTLVYLQRKQYNITRQYSNTKHFTLTVARVWATIEQFVDAGLTAGFHCATAAAGFKNPGFF